MNSKTVSCSEKLANKWRAKQARGRVREIGERVTLLGVEI